MQIGIILREQDDQQTPETRDPRSVSTDENTELQGSGINETWNKNSPFFFPPRTMDFFRAFMHRLNVSNVHPPLIHLTLTFYCIGAKACQGKFILFLTPW